MDPNISDFQLIFEFPDRGVEWRLIDIYRKLSEHRI